MEYIASVRLARWSKPVLWFALLTATGCKSSTSSPQYVCPANEDFTSGATDLVPVSPSPGLVYQSAHANGVVGATLTLSSVRVLMSTENLTEIQLEVRKELDGSFAGTHEQWFNERTEIIAVSSKTSGFESSALPIAVDFNFPSRVDLEVTKTYYFVISAVGGVFYVRTSTYQTINGEAKTRDSLGGWETIRTYSNNRMQSLGMRFLYSQCSGF